MASNQSMSFPLPERAALSPGKGRAGLGEIVVFVDGGTEAAGILDFAGELAEERGAHLTGVFMQPLPTLTPAEAFARGKAMLSVSEAHRAELVRIEADYAALFEDIVRRHGIQSEWRSLSHWNSEVGAHAYYADLVVIARPDSGGQTDGPPGLAESLLLSSGRPIILFPTRSIVSRIRRILVGWNARRESVRAVADALPLLIRAEAVEVLAIDDERHPTGHGKKPDAADVRRHLARRGVNVKVQRLSSEGKEVGHLLLSQADAFGADLVVMGAYGHSHLREWMFGSVTRMVLREASLPVLMSR
jgi:nucleotide-binding universal stress UspA family protein